MNKIYKKEKHFINVTNFKQLEMSYNHIAKQILSIFTKQHSWDNFLNVFN